MAKYHNEMLIRIGKKISDGSIKETMTALTTHVLQPLQRQHAQKPRPDGLQLIIETIVSKQPDIKANGLLHELRKREGEGVIERIDDEEAIIEWRDSKHPAASTPIKALKDRLYRAKKKTESL